MRSSRMPIRRFRGHGAPRRSSWLSRVGIDCVGARIGLRRSDDSGGNRRCGRHAKSRLHGAAGTLAIAEAELAKLCRENWLSVLKSALAGRQPVKCVPITKCVDKMTERELKTMMLTKINGTFSRAFRRRGSLAAADGGKSGRLCRDACKDTLVRRLRHIDDIHDAWIRPKPIELSASRNHRQRL
jgi:hypothetical protein